MCVKAYRHDSVLQMFLGALHATGCVAICPVTLIYLLAIDLDSRPCYSTAAW